MTPSRTWIDMPTCLHQRHYIGSHIHSPQTMFDLGSNLGYCIYMYLLIKPNKCETRTYMFLLNKQTIKYINYVEKDYLYLRMIYHKTI